MEKMTWKQFSSRYCDNTGHGTEWLIEILREQVRKYNPTGFFMAEAQVMDSTWFGQRVILPFGKYNTFKEIPDHPFSPRGLASDTSVVIGYIWANELP